MKLSRGPCTLQEERINNEKVHQGNTSRCPYLQRAAEWYPPAEFVASVLEGADPITIRGLSTEMEELVAYPNLLEMNEKTIEIAERWDAFCADLTHAFQDCAREEVERKG